MVQQPRHKVKPTGLEVAFSFDGTAPGHGAGTSAALRVDEFICGLGKTERLPKPSPFGSVWYSYSFTSQHRDGILSHH